MLVNISFLKTILNGLLVKINDKADKSTVMQSDCAQNDQTQLDYIKNRTHYDSRVIKKNTISYDGRELDTNDVVTVGGPPFFKFDDSILSVSDMIGAQLTIEDYTKEIELEMIQHSDSFWVIVTGGSAIMCIIKENQDHPFALGKTPGLWCGANQSPSGTFIAPSISITCTTQIGELKKLDEKYLPDNALAQPDWSNADECSLAHILNRPFYDDIVYETYTFNNVPSSVQREADLGDIDNDAEFVEGETYTVTVNGEVNSFVATSSTKIEKSALSYIAIKEKTYVQGLKMVGYGWGGSGLTVSVAGPIRHMKKIDEKFLSSTIWEVLVNTTLTKAATCSIDRLSGVKEAFIALGMPKSTDGSESVFTDTNKIFGLTVDNLPLQKPNNCVSLCMHVWKVTNNNATGLITSKVYDPTVTNTIFGGNAMESESHVEIVAKDRATNVIDINSPLPVGTVMYIAIRR